MSNRYAIVIVRVKDGGVFELGVLDKQEVAFLYLNFEPGCNALDTAVKELKKIINGNSTGYWESLGCDDEVTIIKEFETYISDPTVGVRTVTGEVVMANESELKRALESLNEG